MSQYYPFPPRVWSRVQTSCIYSNDNSNNLVYFPLTKSYIKQADADYQLLMYKKGNILQYKANSASLTKKQKYSVLAKGYGPNRTKVFATQSQTYTNPNTTGLTRVNFTSYSYPNQIVGAPNNISGPFQYNVQNPFDCSSNLLIDGGNLLCGSYSDPCSGTIIKTNKKSATLCNPSSSSDVPGNTILCWNNKIQTWYPKPRYYMNNSTNKWPINFKGFQSSVKPSSTLLTYSLDENNVILNWKLINECLYSPTITGFNIYLNNNLLIRLSGSIYSYIYSEPDSGDYIFYVTSISVINGVYNESFPSNKIYINI